MTEARREAWVVEWSEPSGKRQMVGYAFQSQQGAELHITQTKEEDDIRAANGRKPVFKEFTWTVTRYVPESAAQPSEHQTGVCPNCGYGPVIALPEPPKAGET